MKVHCERIPSSLLQGASIGLLCSGIAARRKGYAVKLGLKPLLLVFAVILTGCSGGGGGGDGGGGSPIQTSITASFASAVANPPNNSIGLSQKSVQGDLVTLNVTVTSLGAASSGAAFDVVYDPALVNFIGFPPGTFYESTGAVAYQAALQGGSNNRLVVGITQQAGPGASGSGTIMELQFRVLGIGSSALTFTNNNLTDPTGNLIPGVTWSGGTLTGS